MMKIVKKLFKYGVICLVILLMGYLGLYIYAKTTTKLVIHNLNHHLIYDTNGELVKDLSETWVSLDEISPYVIDATVAIEDKKFFDHHGFDYLRILKSLYVNFKSGQTKQGASTITQQLAKNLYLTFDKTWERKIKEAWLTIELEAQYEKEDILEAYLNTINYGGIYGIEAASKYYFHKSAKELTLAEASILVGIPKSPSNYSPLINEENAKRRQNLILTAMVNEKYITDAEKNKAYQTDLTYYGTPEDNELKTLMYYQDAVMQELDSIDSIPDDLKENGNLKIYTYLDLEVQASLEKAMDDNIENNEIEVASIVMTPTDGHIIALIGGRNYSTSQYNRAINAKRQVGSTMKPFLYYAALENGFTTSTTFTSEKTTFVFSENQTYSPANYMDKYGDKAITMAAAIAYSDNIYAVKTHLFLGEDILVDMAKRLGITSELSPVPSLALGSGEISLYDMVNAYAVFANEGTRIQGKLIAKIEDIDGNILYKNNEKKEAILNSSLVYILNEAMTSTYNYNFIDYNYPTCHDITSTLTHKYAIKTGTTNSDHLIFGYNKGVVIGIWAGYDDGSDSEVSNGKALRYMWRDVAERYLADKEDTWYELPSNVVGTLVNPINGKIANSKTKNATMFYYLKGTEPTYDNQQLEDLIPTIKSE